MIPIIFIHKGNPDYLSYALTQCRLSNPDNPIYLIGDKENNCFNFVTHISADTVDSEGLVQLRKNYIHLSPNPFAFELYCLERWFLALSLCQQFALNEVFIADTDVLVYERIDQYKPWQANSHLISAFGIFERSPLIKLATAHVSFWRLEGLTSFCELIKEFYQSEHYLQYAHNFLRDASEQKLGWGVSDMTILYLFYKKYSENINNISVVSEDNYVFDANYSSTENYVVDEYIGDDYGRKKINRKGGSFYIYHKIYNRDIQLMALHFQGNTKFLMPQYVTGNLSYKTKVKYHLITQMVFILSYSPFIYKIAKNLALRLKLI